MWATAFWIKQVAILDIAFLAFVVILAERGGRATWRSRFGWILVGASAVTAAVLLWLAWKSWTAPVATEAAKTGDSRDALAAFAGTFVLTLSNPATIFSFIAIFGTLGARTAVSSPWPMILGVLIGSALWWLFLSALITHLRERFDQVWQRRVNRASAVLLAGFALWPLFAL